jgi:branched-chain amino acid transport system permease protein
MHEIAQQFVSALAVGSVYALVALGIAVLYNILGLINFAHGELMVVSAYVMSLFTSPAVFGLVVVVGIIAASVATLALERVAFRPVRGAPATTLLLTSFAVSVILQNVCLAVFGGPPRPIPYPDWTRTDFEVAGISIGYFEVVTFVVTLLILGLLTLALRRTVIGIAWRAAAEDFPATRLVGIRANAVILVAFAVSGALAGIAAVFWFSNSGLVGATSGLAPVLKGFIAAILGGLGTLSGPVLGGFLLAALEAFFQIVLPTGALPYVDAFVFVVVIAVLFLRPQGLLTRVAVQKA